MRCRGEGLGRDVYGRRKLSARRPCWLLARMEILLTGEVAYLCREA